MKKQLFFLIFNICTCQFIYSQDSNKFECPYVEVVGTAIREIEPNQIYISITLSEKSIDDKKYSIEIQENKLLNILKELNISNSKLTLSDFNSTIITQKNKEIGFKQSKEFFLVLDSAEQVSNLFVKLFEVNIKEAEIIKVEHTDIVKYNKEVRIEAVKSAKEKAEYILNAIGSKIGKPLEIIEQNLDFNYQYNNNANVLINDLDYSKSEFKKIIISFSYKVKYSIE